ncbi:GIY-YIG nuclease family protein [Terriglobus sp.]|uniref:GIY-YIG nuclease family protein n=1 Tax=Terriglobus sp. TaxID=1889013 RepID=UPI003B003E31
MNAEFASLIAELPALCKVLRQSAPLRPDEIKSLKRGGVYIFTESKSVLYCGRTRNLSQRFQAHCHSSSGENKAAFAFRLARQESGFLKASYTKKNSRKDLMKLPEFNMAFRNAKSRIARMELRFVIEEDDTRQAMLEFM